MTTPKIQKTEAAQENIYMPTRNRAFPIFPFPEMEKLPVTLSKVKQQSFPRSSYNELIYLWLKIT